MEAALMTGNQSPSGGESELGAVLEAAGRGDEDAWRDLVDRYGRRVFALARSRLSGDEVAEEVTQSVFATVAIRLRDGGYRERGRFEAWLFRIAMNRVRDEARGRKRGRRGQGSDALAGARAPGGEVRDHEALEALRDAVQRLSDPDREVIELRHHAGLSFKEIAEVLEEPLGTLLARHHRALRKLRKMMEAGRGPAEGMNHDTRPF